MLGAQGSSTEGLDQGEVFMSEQVILDFDDQADALGFALAAGSVMAGDRSPATTDLFQKTTRVSRIRVNGTSRVGAEQPNPPDRAA